MVSKRHGIISHFVHRRHDRMLLIRLFIRDIIGHNGSLDGIARINQEDDGVFLPDFLNISIHTGHTVVGCLCIVLVGIAPCIGMQIRGQKNHRMDVFFLIFRRSRTGNHKANQSQSRYQA